MVYPSKFSTKCIILWNFVFIEFLKLGWCSFTVNIEKFWEYVLSNVGNEYSLLKIEKNL